ncbi:MAG: hypothetical protein JXA10_16480 [Anaerolineae bacterium]|nr:hypothetical protein [Anaerolineae bacterium]
MRSIIGLVLLIAALFTPVFGAIHAQENLTQSQARGYLTTPGELHSIQQKAARGLEPYRSAVANVLAWADEQWNYDLETEVSCPNANKPQWIENEHGVAILYAKALAYHLTGEITYADEVKTILQTIMTEIASIPLDAPQCELNFAWGVPELVAAADLIEDYWYDQTCTGPLETGYGDNAIGEGNCKDLFQNWLVKNPYFVISLTAEEAQSNWGAAATNTLAYIADYLWDRPEVTLIHRTETRLGDGEPLAFTPAEAYNHANQLALDRMNGYRVEYRSSSSCDELGGKQQSDAFPPVKSQITPAGIIPEDARRDESCNVPAYNGKYQNYPQVHVGNNVQQCELMLRRGDTSCYNNIDLSDIAAFTFTDRDGETQTTHLYPGRGSLEQAINAIIVASRTEWRHDAALEVAYRYYYTHHTQDDFLLWFQELNRPAQCDQDICFGTLTHGFAPGEALAAPPVVPPPSD